MTDALIGIIVAGLLAISSVLALRDVSRRRWQRSLVTYALRLPQGLAPADVAAFLTACTGMRARRWQRPFVVRALVLETVATSEGVVHHLAVPAGFSEIVLGALRGAERIVVQWVLAPTGPLSVPVVASGRTSKGSPTLARARALRARVIAALH